MTRDLTYIDLRIAKLNTKPVENMRLVNKWKRKRRAFLAAQGK